MKMFNRSGPSMASNVQIINYQVTSSLQWCLLVGLVFGSELSEPSGILQLHSVLKTQSQNVVGRNGVFASIILPDKTSPIEVSTVRHHVHVIVCDLCRACVLGFVL